MAFKAKLYDEVLVELSQGFGSAFTKQCVYTYLYICIDVYMYMHVFTYTCEEKTLLKVNTHSQNIP